MYLIDSYSMCMYLKNNWWLCWMHLIFTFIFINIIVQYYFIFDNSYMISTLYVLYFAMCNHKSLFLLWLHIIKCIVLLFLVYEKFNFYINLPTIGYSVLRNEIEFIAESTVTIRWFRVCHRVCPHFFITLYKHMFAMSISMTLHL